MTVQAGLCRPWSKSQIVVFLVRRLICNRSVDQASGLLHYVNMPMQYTEIFWALKFENFQLKNFDIFLIFA